MEANQRALWHTRDVQKLCALLLLTLSAWLLVAPLAVSRQQQNLLPACCRRLGVHHCAQSVAMQSALDRRHASLRSTGCLLMPHGGAAILEQLIGTVTLAVLPLLLSCFPFFTIGALEDYARALALRSPRGPPCFSLA